MHLEMLIVLITTLAVAQIILIQWKQRHFRSYQLVTTLGERMLRIWNVESLRKYRAYCF